MAGDERPGNGGRQCGSVRYTLSAPPVSVYVCHCTECRAQSASAFGISVIVPATGFAVVRGTPATWTRATPHSLLDCHFCPTCGTRLWHAARDDPEHVSVKGGSLDRPPDLSAARHIWTASRLPGLPMPPGVETWPGEPPD